jgi:hypothetical protein
VTYDDAGLLHLFTFIILIYQFIVLKLANNKLKYSNLEHENW